jgi:hypothetical protein
VGLVRSPGRRRRRPRAALAAGLFLGLAGMSAGLAGCGRASQAQHDADAASQVRAAQARTIARQAGLGLEVQDFLAQAAAAGSVTYTVVYDQGAGQTTTVMAHPPDRRIDIQGANGSVDRVVIKGTATYLCHLTGRPWACSSGVTAAPSGPFTPDAITQTIASLAQLSQGYDFTVNRRPMLGQQARCLAADRKPNLAADPNVGNPAALCIAAGGVILRLEGGGTTLQATSYRSSVPSGAFDLPARPVPVPPPTSAPVPTILPLPRSVPHATSVP